MRYETDVTDDSEPEMPVSIERTVTSRGFDHMPPIPGSHGGHVRAYESSNADGPHIWHTATVPADLNRPSGPTVEAPCTRRRSAPGGWPNSSWCWRVTTTRATHDRRSEPPISLARSAGRRGPTFWLLLLALAGTVLSLGIVALIDLAWPAFITSPVSVLVAGTLGGVLSLCGCAAGLLIGYRTQDRR